MIQVFGFKGKSPDWRLGHVDKTKTSVKKQGDTFMARHYPGWPSATTARITCAFKRHSGKITGTVIKVTPVETPRQKIPMSMLEALTIANSLEPGALRSLHRRGIEDHIALRALEVTGVIKTDKR